MTKNLYLNNILQILNGFCRWVSFLATDISLTLVINIDSCELTFPFVFVRHTVLYFWDYCKEQQTYIVCSKIFGGHLHKSFVWGH